MRAVDRGDQRTGAFEDKPFKAYLNKRLSKRRKLDIAHGSLNFIEKTFHPDVLPQLYNVADFGREMFSIPLKNGDKLDVKLLASPFQEEGELMLQLFLATGASIASVFLHRRWPRLYRRHPGRERYHQ